MPLLVDGECLLDRPSHPRVYMIEQDEGPVLEHVRCQYMPQLRCCEIAVRIQFLEELLPGHQHRLQIQKHERQLITCTETVPVIR